MCGARLAHNFALDCHMRGVHSDEKPYQCNVCFEKFAHRNLYTIHMHRHTGEKPFKCDYPGCTYASADSSNLSHHKKSKWRFWSPCSVFAILDSKADLFIL